MGEEPRAVSALDDQECLQSLMGLDDVNQGVAYQLTRRTVGRRRGATAPDGGEHILARCGGLAGAPGWTNAPLRT